MNPNDAITVVIPTSPLWINPSTEIIDETYAQIRKHLPTAKILILADGVHPEEQYLAKNYHTYLKRLGYKTFEYTNTTVFSFGEWLHQSGMLRRLLLEQDGGIETPLVFWSEHDIPLRNDFIDWQGIVDTLLDGKIGAIRFELTGDPPKRDETKGLITPHGIPVMLSTQYVNWPQVFRLDYFTEMIARFEDARTYLECSERDGIVKELWSKWRYGIYSPEDEIRRCYHTHGRERGAPGLGKPYIEVDGKRRHVYGSYTPYTP